MVVLAVHVAAMAPPMVTWRVPGDTGTNQPDGSPATISCSRLTPASQLASPSPGPVDEPGQLGGGDHDAAAALRGVVVAAAKPAGDQAGRGGPQQLGGAGDGAGLGQFGRGWGDPAPAGEGDGAAALAWSCMLRADRPREGTWAGARFTTDRSD